MVHVTMRQHDTAQFVLVLDHVIVVRQYQVNPVHFVIGEHNPAIDNNHVAAIFVDGHVFANFPQAAQGNDP